eukprot:1000842_1
MYLCYPSELHTHYFLFPHTIYMLHSTSILRCVHLITPRYSHISTTKGYVVTLLAVNLPLSALQNNINLFYTFVKYYSFMSDDQYRIFHDMSTQISAHFGASLQYEPIEISESKERIH